MNKFIAFSGLDGSGKSTQIDLLKEYFVSNKKSVLVFWSRGGYTPGFVFLKKCLRLIAGTKLPKAGNSKERDKRIGNPKIQRIWLNISLLDMIFYYSIYLRIQKMLLRKTIICDRYIYDTFIDFKLTFPNQDFENFFLWRTLNKLALKPSKHFVALVSVEESRKRSIIKGEPFPDTAETLKNRLSFYQEYLKSPNSIYIDGLDDRLDIHNRIVNEVVEK